MQPSWPIETERPVLRPYEERDLEPLHALYREPDVVRWLYDEPHAPERLVYAILEREWR